MILLCAIFMVMTFVMPVLYFWERLDRRKESSKWFLSWVIRGLAVPTGVWMFFNMGLFRRLPSMSPELDLAPPKEWFSTYLKVTAIGLVVIAMVWAIVSMGLVLVRIGLLIKDRREFLTLVGIWALFGCLLEWLLLRYAGQSVGLFFAVGWPFLLAYATIALTETETPTPIYSRAVARMQVGKYEDAEVEVLRELEKDESDFQGWLMLAELYAIRFNDLPAADRTIHEICRDPKTTVPQIAEALNKLADWYLNAAHDPASARRVVEEICQRLPDTHLARMARLRINQMPRTRDALQRPARPIPLPHVDLNLDVPAPSAPARTTEESAAKANALAEKLKTAPNDIKSREELARIYAEDLDKVEEALAQMELLLTRPNIPPRQGAEWLNRMSTWLVRFRQDEPGAQRLLERLINDYPQSVEAFTAQRRLSFMRQEVKVRRLRTYLPE